MSSSFNSSSPTLFYVTEPFFRALSERSWERCLRPMSGQRPGLCSYHPLHITESVQSSSARKPPKTQGELERTWLLHSLPVGWIRQFCPPLSSTPVHGYKTADHILKGAVLVNLASCLPFLSHLLRDLPSSTVILRDITILFTAWTTKETQHTILPLASERLLKGANSWDHSPQCVPFHNCLPILRTHFQ